MNPRSTAKAWLMSAAVSALLTGGFVATPALSAETTAADTGAVLGEVVVTARRREEGLQSVPIAITALTQQQLDRKQIRSVYDLQFVTPGLLNVGTSVRGRSSGTQQIRGQSNADTDSPPGVVAYFADVPIFNEQVAHSSYDLASIQILKGPQGTLFGQNTNGGAELFVPVKPTGEFQGYLKARYGNYNDRYAEGAINIPLVGDRLAIRIAGNIERQDGFTKNIAGHDLDDLNYQSGRVSILFRPTDTIESTTILTSLQSMDYGPGYIMTTLLPCTTPGAATGSCQFIPANLSKPGALLGAQLSGASGLLPATEVFALQQKLGIRGVSNPYPPFQKYHTYGAINTTSWAVSPNLTLKNIVGFNSTRWNSFLDSDGTADSFLSVAYRRKYVQFTEEFQVQGSASILSYTAGAYYSKATERPFHHPNPGNLSYLDNTTATSQGRVVSPFVQQSVQYIDRNNTSKALYAQGTLDLGTWLHGLKFTAGYRYTWDTRTLREQVQSTFYPGTIVAAFAATQTPVTTCGYTAAIAAAAPGLIDLPTCTLSTSAKFAAPNWNLSLDWQATDHMLLYAAHRHGYKTGGFNATGNFVAGLVYRPEKVNDAEIGIKSDFNVGGMALRINADVFYDWYKDRQIANVVYPCPQGPPTCNSQNLLQNIGNIHLKGAEGEVTLIPVPHLTLTAGYAYFSGTYVSGVLTLNGGGKFPLNGQSYTGQPKNTYNLSAAYDHEMGEAGNLVFNLDYAWRSSFNIALNPVAATAIAPSVGLLNGGITWERAMGQPLELNLFVKNITNEGTRYVLGYSDGLSFGFASRFYGPPRTYGVQLTYRFGE